MPTHCWFNALWLVGHRDAAKVHETGMLGTYCKLHQSPCAHSLVWSTDKEVHAVWCVFIALT